MMVSYLIRKTFKGKKKDGPDRIVWIILKSNGQ